jgi:uncharacterized membrane protein
VGEASQVWSWVLTAFGLVTFWLAGRKTWWAWYVGIAGQVVWTTYAIVTGQWGFILGSVAYTFIYVKNAVRWTKEHRAVPYKTEEVVED